MSETIKIRMKVQNLDSLEVARDIYHLDKMKVINGIAPGENQDEFIIEFIEGQSMVVFGIINCFRSTLVLVEES